MSFLDDVPDVFEVVAGAVAALQLTRGTADEKPVQPPPYRPAVREKDGLIAAAGLVEAVAEHIATQVVGRQGALRAEVRVAWGYPAVPPPVPLPSVGVALRVVLFD